MKIEWAYMRNGWASCKKAQKFFEQKKGTIETRINAGKEKIDRKHAWEILSNKETICIGKGKKTLLFKPAPEAKEQILTAVMGRSGNLRALTLIIGSDVFIGYNDTIYDSI